MKPETKKQLKKIAVVILNWNGAKLLEQFLPSVIAFSEEATIYVADNASTDDSIKIIQNQFPSVNIIKNTGNFGYAKGYNEALKFVEEEYYALVNSDIEVTQNWLAPILTIFETQPKTAIIQPKLLDFKKKTHFEYAGAAGGFIDKFGYPFCRGRIFDTIEEDKQQYEDEINSELEKLMKITGMSNLNKEEELPDISKKPKVEIESNEMMQKECLLDQE